MRLSFLTSGAERVDHKGFSQPSSQEDAKISDDPRVDEVKTGDLIQVTDNVTHKIIARGKVCFEKTTGGGSPSNKHKKLEGDKKLISLDDKHFLSWMMRIIQLVSLNPLLIKILLSRIMQIQDGPITVIKLAMTTTFI